MRKRRNSWLATAAGIGLAFAVGWTPAMADHDLFRRISAGQINGNGGHAADFARVTSDGRRAFFRTEERLVAADTDSAFDLYQRYGGTTTLITAGAINGNGPFAAGLVDINVAGTTQIFQSDEQLTTSDTDANRDLYRRSGGVTTKVSTGSGPFDSNFEGASADLSRVYFSTDAQLVAGDIDHYTDVYLREGGSTIRMSRGSINGNGAHNAFGQRVSDDGSRLIFLTDERLLPADTDSARDIYMRTTGGTTTLVSGGSGPFTAYDLHATPDLEHYVFTTEERLLGSDTDSVEDLYMRSGGALVHVSVVGDGPFEAHAPWVIADGSRVFFHTEERLVSTDTDSSDDLYVRAGFATIRLSVGEINGNGAYPAAFRGTSADGLTVFFETDERLVASDTDNWQDVYARQGNKTQLMSRGAINGNGMINAYFAGVSADGTRVFFRSSERLHPDDADGTDDIYERYGGATYLLTVGPENTQYVGASRDGTRVFVETHGSMVANDTDGAQDVYSVMVGI